MSVDSGLKITEAWQNAAMTASEPVQHQDDRALRIAAVVVAAAGMLVAGYFYLASGLLVPGWALIPLWIIWFALVWYGVRLARAGSYLVLAVPVVAGVLWFLVITLGEQLLGWTG